MSLATIHSIQLGLARLWSLEEYGDDSKDRTLAIRFAHIAIALLETIQKMGYDETSCRKSSVSYQSLVRGNDLFNCMPILTHTAVSYKVLCYVSCTRVND